MHQEHTVFNLEVVKPWATEKKWAKAIENRTIEKKRYRDSQATKLPTCATKFMLPLHAEMR